MSNKSPISDAHPVTEAAVRAIIAEDVLPRISNLESEMTLMRVAMDENSSVMKDILKIVSETMIANKQWKDHDKRLKHVESDQKMLKSTVKLHSRQIAGL